MDDLHLGQYKRRLTNIPTLRTRYDKLLLFSRITSVPIRGYLSIRLGNPTRPRLSLSRANPIIPIDSKRDDPKRLIGDQARSTEYLKLYTRNYPLSGIEVYELDASSQYVVPPPRYAPRHHPRYFQSSSFFDTLFCDIEFQKTISYSLKCISLENTTLPSSLTKSSFAFRLLIQALQIFSDDIHIPLRLRSEHIEHLDRSDILIEYVL